MCRRWSNAAAPNGTSCISSGGSSKEHALTDVDKSMAASPSLAPDLLSSTTAGVSHVRSGLGGESPPAPALRACRHSCCFSQEPQSTVHGLAIGKEVHEIVLDQHQVRSGGCLPIILAAHPALEDRKIVF